MKKLTTEEFVEKARLIHGNKYDYTHSTYTGAHKKLIINCFLHGEFSQSSNQHLQGHGCPKCSISNITKSKEKFVLEANTLHGNKYSYNSVNYTNTNTKVVITCPIHGDFEMLPSNHLRGQNCPKCGTLNMVSKQSSNTTEFIEKASKKHNDVYTYTNTNYVNARTKVSITCSVHGDFEQTPDAHLRGSGCPECASSGFNPNKPAYLYYLKVTTDSEQVLYKIGITNRTVNERFNLTDLSKIEIIKQKLYDKGQDALDWETKLKQKYKEYQYTGPDILENGNTELFIEDILTMYYNE